MRLIVIPDIAEGNGSGDTARLRQALSAYPLNVLLTEAARRAFRPTDDAGSREAGVSWVIPQQWDLPLPPGAELLRYADVGEAVKGRRDKDRSWHPWLVLSNGRFVTQANKSLLDQVLAENHADVVAIRVSPQLRARREHIRLTSQGDLVGCRRLYRDMVEPVPLPADWPHHVFVKADSAERLLEGGWIPDMRDVLARCRTLGLKVRSFAIAGTEIDLMSSRGVLTLCGDMVSLASHLPALSSRLYDKAAGHAGLGAGISPQARLVGPILIGKGVRIEPGAVVVGPAVLCNDSTVGRDGLVDVSVVGPGVTLDPGRELVGSCVLTDGGESRQTRGGGAAGVVPARCIAAVRTGSEFRTWPWCSYARCVKRVADVIMAVIVILLFAPVIPFIALAIRLSSPGPIFYKDWRQGLHGRPFHCIKFRTMRVGAAEIQDKLRFVSEVDGPQFKINDDPRISSVGRFLRETSIDEIPQFFNVLVGQMSVVGPRPSPEAENTQCPSWRDARLSVRPGITGLWQVCRTRQPFKDFQEWIYYDTKYVRELSLRNDLWICVQTFRRLLWSFVEQF
jgi:lipopolysaccharide/colanic/teichoic acid biosynthesis glycosyltransferase